MNSTAHTEIVALKNALLKSFKERNSEIEGALVALLSGEHVLMFGPPGTGKSALANAICNSLDGGQFFGWLLTKFSTPEELFGPISLKALEQDKYTRHTTGKLPEAHIAFLDEIFKANSSILNSLLTLVNERVFHNNGGAVKCPLLTVFGASNELPEGDSLEALYDRFLVRYWTKYVSDRDNLKAMLTDADPTSTVKVSMDTLRQAQTEVAGISFPDDTLEALLDLKGALEAKGFKVSDRRWKRIIKALRAAAYLCGDDEVCQDHFDMIPAMMWREPKDLPVITEVVMDLSNPLFNKVLEIFDSAKEIVSNLPAESSKTQFLAACATANDQLDKMIREVTGIINGKLSTSKKAKAEVIMVEIKQMHQSVQKRAAKAIGVKM